MIRKTNVSENSGKGDMETDRIEGLEENWIRWIKGLVEKARGEIEMRKGSQSREGKVKYACQNAIFFGEVN